MISAALLRRAARTVSDPPAAPYQSRTALMLCGAAFFALSQHPALSQTASGAVQSVEVRGAEFIPANDIQMTCGAEVGVAYSDYDLRAIEECLMSTGAFESVALTREGAGLVITVQELDTRPGRVEAALSYVSQEGLVASLSFERYNLFPKTYGAMAFEFNDEIRSFSASLYRRELFGDHVDLGFDVIGGRANYDDLSYSQKSLRIEPYLAWRASEALRIEGGLGYRDHRIFDLDPSASALLQAEQNDGVSAPYLRLGISYARGGDTGAAVRATGEDTAAPNAPHFGYSLSLTQYMWNIGTEDALFDTRAEARAQFALSDRMRLLVGVKAGSVHGTNGNATRALDRAYPGADQFRGFSPRGIGPRDGSDALGGNHYATASFELQRDFDTKWETPLRAGLFIDTGASWGLDDTLGGRIDDEYHRRSSIGASLTFDVGQTPVSLYLAKPIEREDQDEEQIFGLMISSKF